MYLLDISTWATIVLLLLHCHPVLPFTLYSISYMGYTVENICISNMHWEATHSNHFIHLPNWLFKLKTRNLGTICLLILLVYLHMPKQKERYITVSWPLLRDFYRNFVAENYSRLDSILWTHDKAPYLQKVKTLIYLPKWKTKEMVQQEHRYKGTEKWLPKLPNILPEPISSMQRACLCPYKKTYLTETTSRFCSLSTETYLFLCSTR